MPQVAICLLVVIHHLLFPVKMFQSLNRRAENIPHAQSHTVNNKSRQYENGS